MLNESVKPVNVLTDEQLQNIQQQFVLAYMDDSVTSELCDLVLLVAKSHRSLNSRNAKLIHENDELMAQVEQLNWICQRSSDFIDAMVGFTGQNLSVFNWHQNGDGEPFDNFVEENLEENLITDLKTALEELKHE